MKPLRTRGLVRRVTPFMGTGIIALAALADPDFVRLSRADVLAVAIGVIVTLAAMSPIDWDRLPRLTMGVPVVIGVLLAMGGPLSSGSPVALGVAAACAVAVLALYGLPWDRIPRWAHTIPVFAAILAVVAVQATAGTAAPLAFPLLLIAVLFAALHNSRGELLAAAGLAGLAFLVAPVARGNPPGETATAIVLVAVLWIIAAAVREVVRQGRDAAAKAEREAGEVRSSEERLRMTLETAPVGLALITDQGRWTQVNEQLCTILDRTREELLQMTVSDVTAESDLGALEGALNQLRNKEILRWETELTQVLPDGRRIPVAITIAAVDDQSAPKPLMLVQETDISARKRLEGIRDCLVAVRHAIVSASTWDDAAPQVLSSLCTYLDWDIAQYWAVDTERRALHCRSSWHRAGAALDDFDTQGHALWITAGPGLLGRVWQSGVPSAQEDLAQSTDYEQAGAAQQAGLRSAAAFPVINAGTVLGLIELVAYDVRHIDNDLLTMLSTAGVEVGQFIHRAETLQALSRSEADHRAIYERSPIGIARVSVEGEFLEGNKSLLEMLGYDLETMRGQAWSDLLRAYDQAAARHRLAPLLAGITGATSVQLRAATGSGKWLWLQLTATSIPDATGRPEHLLVMVEDVTTVRETQDKLAEALEAQRGANATLEKLDRTKTEFLSIVSHEFRTALTGIQGFSELIRDGGLMADEVRAYGGYIFNDADRVNRLIGDMLDLDRMESGRMSIRMSDVDINEVLTDSLTRAIPSSDTVELKSDLDPRLPIVTGDRDRLIQVVSNLVNNAIKYSPEGGTVTLVSRTEGGFALVSITDTGVGIPPDEIAHVFERFRRVRSGAAQAIPGTGLGLTIVKQIVEMHGGRIWVESAVGHGSAFHFTIPLATAMVNPMQRRHA